MSCYTTKLYSSSGVARLCFWKGRGYGVRKLMLELKKGNQPELSDDWNFCVIHCWSSFNWPLSSCSYYKMYNVVTKLAFNQNFGVANEIIECKWHSCHCNYDIIAKKICCCREYITSCWLLKHAPFSHLLVTHWLCIVIILIMVQTIVKHGPVLWQWSILTSPYSGEYTWEIQSEMMMSRHVQIMW